MNLKKLVGEVVGKKVRVITGITADGKYLKYNNDVDGEYISLVKIVEKLIENDE